MNTFFLTCAVVGAVILCAQLVLGIVGGDHDGAIHDGGVHNDAPAAGLQLFSARALSAAVAFFGIGALAASSLHWPSPLAVLAGAALGGAAMFGVAYMMRTMLRFEHDGSIRIYRAIGEAATVYVPVPAGMSGAGKVSLTLQGRTVEYQAMTSEGHHLPTGTSVVIVDVRNDDTVEVATLPSLDGVQ